MTFLTVLAFCLLPFGTAFADKVQSVVAEQSIENRRSQSAKNKNVLLKAYLDNSSSSRLISNGKAGGEENAAIIHQLISDLDEYHNVIEAALAIPPQQLASSLSQPQQMDQFKNLKSLIENDTQMDDLLRTLNKSARNVKDSLNSDEHVQHTVMKSLKKHIEEAANVLAIRWHISLNEIKPRKNDQNDLVLAFSKFWHKFKSQKESKNEEKSEEQQQSKSHHEKHMLQLMVDYSAVCLDAFDKPKKCKRRKRRNTGGAVDCDDDNDQWTKKKILFMLVGVVAVVLLTFLIAKCVNPLCNPRKPSGGDIEAGGQSAQGGGVHGHGARSGSSNSSSGSDSVENQQHH